MSCTFVWSLNRSIVPRPENRSPRSSVSHHKNACVALFDGSQSEREGLSSWGASRASILREKRCKGPRQDARIFTSPHLAAADRRCLSRVSVPLLPDTQSRRLMAAQAHFVISARVRHTTLAGLRAARKYSNSGARSPESHLIALGGLKRRGRRCLAGLDCGREACPALVDHRRQRTISAIFLLT